jgi:hypothetical protein
VDLRRDDLVRAAGDRGRSPADRLASVEREIRQAQAEALGRTGERLQGILDRLAWLDRRLDALLAGDGSAAEAPADPDAVLAETEARNRLRDDADRVRQQLMIQREALGLVRQTPVEQCYPVPARRRVPAPADDRGNKP